VSPRTALDWAAIAVEEHGRELAQSFFDAAERGDWRAAEALMNRITESPRRRSLPRSTRIPPRA
jgi:hypothetical protein